MVKHPHGLQAHIACSISVMSGEVQLLLIEGSVKYKYMYMNPQREEQKLFAEQCTLHDTESHKPYTVLSPFSAPALISAPPCFWGMIGLVLSFPTVVSDWKSPRAQSQRGVRLHIYYIYSVSKSPPLAVTGPMGSWRVSYFSVSAVKDSRIT